MPRPVQHQHDYGVTLQQLDAKIFESVSGQFPVHESDDLLYNTQAGAGQCHHDHLTVSNCKTIGMFESSQGTCQIKALSKALVKALAIRSEKIPYIISSVDRARRF